MIGPQGSTFEFYAEASTVRRVETQKYGPTQLRVRGDLAGKSGKQERSTCPN